MLIQLHSQLKTVWEQTGKCTFSRFNIKVCTNDLNICPKAFKYVDCNIDFLSELEVRSLGTVHVGLHRLGPFNWAAKALVISKVQQKMRDDSQILYCKECRYLI